MDFTILLLATSFAEAWSKWFFIGIAIGMPLIVVAAVITYFQMKNSSDKMIPKIPMTNKTKRSTTPSKEA